MQASDLWKERVGKELEVIHHGPFEKKRLPWEHTSDRDQHNWTSRMRQRLGYNSAEADADDGSFWMSWQDFCRNYSTISLCRMFELVGDGCGFE